MDQPTIEQDMSRPRLMNRRQDLVEKVIFDGYDFGVLMQTLRVRTGCFSNVMVSIFGVPSILNIAIGDYQKASCWMTWMCSSTV